MLDTMETLCCLDGVSGSEGEIRDYILERTMPLADEIITDAIGNILVFKKGARTPAQKLMLCAHMDEVGLIVTHITDDGYLKFDTVGGIDRRRRDRPPRASGQKGICRSRARSRLYRHKGHPSDHGGAAQERPAHERHVH